VVQRRKIIKTPEKKKFLNSAYMNIDRRSLGIYSQVFCRVFTYAVIYTAKYRLNLVLRFGAIHSVAIIWMKISF
jgi:uncharacterized membrane protein